MVQCSAVISNINIEIMSLVMLITAVVVLYQLNLNLITSRLHKYYGKVYNNNFQVFVANDNIVDVTILLIIS